MAAAGSLEIEMLAAVVADDAGRMTALTNLINDVYAVAEEGLWVEGATRTTVERVTALGRAGEMAVARMDGQIVGCVRIRILDASIGEFGMLAVAPSLRGTGVGRNLVRFAEDAVRETRRDTMRLGVLVPRGWSHPSKVFLTGCAMGVPLAERGARTDEYIAAMRALWTDPEPSFDGRFVAFDGLYQSPPPVQRPHPPIVIGGHSRAAYRRAVTAANGWYGVYLDIEQTALALSELREVAASCQRPPQLGDLEITVTPPPGPMDLPTMRGYGELGVHRLVLQPAAPDASDMEELIEATARTLIGQA